MARTESDKLEELVTNLVAEAMSRGIDVDTRNGSGFVDSAVMLSRAIRFRWTRVQL